MKLKLYQNLSHLAYKLLYQLGQVLQLLPLLIQPFGIQGGGEPFFTWVLGGGANQFLLPRRFLTTFSSIWSQSYVITIAPALI